MNKQELLEELVRMSDTTKVSDRGSDYDRAFNLGHRFALNKVLLLIDHQLDEDEPQKVKVPEFIADWIEEYKKDGRTLYQVMNDIECAVYYHKGKDLAYKWLFIDEDAGEHQKIFATAYTSDYEVEEPKWVANEGDLVIRKGEHEAKIYFVESIDDDGILLVNGIKDQFFTDLPERAVGDESVSYFYKNFRLLAKKENLEVEQVEV